MERQRPTPNGAEHFRARPIDVRGEYQGVTVNTPEDAIRAGIRISYTAAEQTWGAEAAQRMRKVDATAISERIAKGFAANGQPKTGVIFSQT